MKNCGAGVGGPKFRVHPPPRRMVLPPGSIWSTGQLIGLGYRKILGEAVCPPIEGLPGTKFASVILWHQTRSRRQHSHYILSPTPWCFCSMWKLGFKWRAWKYTGGTQWGSSLQAHLSLLPSLLSFIAVLRTTPYSDRRMPYTRPRGLKLVERRDCRSSTIFLSKSMSHSKGVGSARAEWVVRSALAYSFWHKAVDTPWGGHLGESISVGHLNSTARMISLIRGRAICDLARYLVIFFIPSTFYLPFSSKRVNLHPTRVSQYQLDCAFRYVIVTWGFVPSVVGRVVGLDASSVEASSHFHNIGKDSPKKHACTHHGKRALGSSDSLRGI